jgi:nucleolar protein 14
VSFFTLPTFRPIMGKGSQLTKLKAALSQSGLTGNQQPKGSKKRKRSAIGSHDAAAEKARRERKLEEIKKSVDVSPFDVKVTKLKHEVGGRRVKGVIGRPGLSKQTGMELVSGRLVIVFLMNALYLVHVPSYREGGNLWPSSRRRIVREG